VTHEELLARVTVDPKVCTGKPGLGKIARLGPRHLTLRGLPTPALVLCPRDTYDSTHSPPSGLDDCRGRKISKQ
jgi:hypothetical protein